MKIATILEMIDMRAMALPEFQRGYVWNRDQVRGLMTSLYRKHPVGSLLVWETNAEGASTRGDTPLSHGTVKLLLDGQQRITSLYGIIKGHAPKFFDGNAQTFTGLYFNLDDETFEFFAPMKMKDNALWINVTQLMQEGVAPFVQRILTVPEFQPQLPEYINRLNAIVNVKEIDLHIEEVTGADKTVDIVVDIFNRVNSGGTKLSKGDLALAKICAGWPEARGEMKERLRKWGKAGFDFRLEWLLRCITAITTGKAMFDHLKDVDSVTFRQGLLQAEKSIDTILNMISGRLGLDHDRVLGSRYSFPVIARYLIQRGGRLADHAERDKLLYWNIHAYLWGRYAGSTESFLTRDLSLIEETDVALDRLIDQLRQQRGDLRLHPNDFLSWSQGSRFYPLLYMMTRVCHAQDWGSGLELSAHMLGVLSRLQVHHIFPKAKLYKAGISRSEVNAVANFTFLTQETNLRVSDRDPEIYFEEIAQKYPGALESHWIPMDRALWKIDRYRDFLAARRELLADAANRFLDSLLAGSVPEVQQPAVSVLERTLPSLPSNIASEDEEQQLQAINQWVAQQGLPEGEWAYEILSPDNSLLLATLDLAWPNGLQEGLSQPVAMLLDEPEEVEQAANAAGFRYFTDVDAFKQYVETEVMALEPQLLLVEV